MRKPRVLRIPLALGDLYKKAGKGGLILPLDGAIARLNAVTEVLPEIPGTIICTAGHSRKSPREPIPERKVSLAAQMERYLREDGSYWHQYYVSAPTTWGTLGEIRSGIRWFRRKLRAEGVDPENEDVTLVISSNFAHLAWRIWLYALMYKPRRWKLKLVRARHRFSLMSHLQEPLKLLFDLSYAAEIGGRVREFRRLRTWQQWRKKTVGDASTVG